MTVRKLMAPLALLTLLLTLAVGVAQPVAAATDYTCPNKLCTFSVPDSYTEVDKSGTSLTLKDMNTGGAFAILLIDAQGVGLAEATNASVAEFVKSDGFTPDSAGVRDEAVGGLAAKSFTYASNNSSGTLVIHKAYFLLRNGVFFNINFFTTPEQADAYIASANDILASFKFA